MGFRVTRLKTGNARSPPTVTASTGERPRRNGGDEKFMPFSFSQSRKSLPACPKVRMLCQLHQREDPRNHPQQSTSIADVYGRD